MPNQFIILKIVSSHSLQVRLKSLRTFLLGTLLIYLCQFSSTHSDPFSYPQPETDSSLEYHEYLLEELNHRRRLQFLFPNPQTIFDGLNIGFVQTSSGNLTFERRDLVVLGLDSLVVSRVYDSRSNSEVGFGPGWQLNLIETIELEGGMAIYKDENGGVHRLKSAGADLYSPLVTSPARRDMSLRVIGNAAVIRTVDGSIRNFKLVEESDIYVLTRRSSGDGPAINMGYDGLYLKEVKVQGKKVLTLEWSNNRIVGISDKHQRRATFKYDLNGNLVTATDIGQQSWTYQYDPSRRLITAAYPDGQLYLEVEYDTLGKVSRSLTARDYSFHYYDNSTTVIEPNGKRHEFIRSSAGITVGYRNHIDLEWNIFLDTENRLEKLVRNGDSYRYQYIDSKVQVIDHPLGSLHFHYDVKHRFTSVTGTPLVGHYPMQVAYGPQNEITVSDGRGNFSYSHDDRGRLRTIDENGISYEISYDRRGFVTALSQGDAVVAYNRNEMGRITSVQYPEGDQSLYEYDDLGNRNRIDFSSGASMNIRHDGRGNIIHVAETNSDGVEITQSYEIDAQNRVSKIEFAGSTEINVSYDDSGRPKQFEIDGKMVEVEYLGTGEPFRLRSGQLTKLLQSKQDSSLFLPVSPSPRKFLHHDRRMGGQPHYGLVDVSSDRLDVRLVPIEFNAVPGYLNAKTILLTAKQWLTDSRDRQVEKPSNPIFQPPEYESTNCCVACPWTSSCGWYCTAVYGTSEETCQCTKMSYGPSGGPACSTSDPTATYTARQTLVNQLGMLPEGKNETLLIVDCPIPEIIDRVTDSDPYEMCLNLPKDPRDRELIIYMGHTHPKFDERKDLNKKFCYCDGDCFQISRPYLIQNLNSANENCSGNDQNTAQSYPLLLRTPRGRIKEC